MSRRHPKSFVRRERGFALLITITLLAFLVLLLVSLASLTRVETQVASNNQQLAQARQNALMALNIAVGQLQKYAGPDQRTTARADLQNTPGQTNSQWVGVYGSSVPADYTATPSVIAADLTNASNVNAYGSSARLLNWLVSGNETAAFNPAWGTGSVGSTGQISTPVASIPFQPSDAVTGLAATSDTNSTLTIKTPNDKARLLVGKNSVISSTNASSQPIDYVVAPAVDIDVAASTVPGAGSSGTVTVGRYAWWVGDEGVKARVNLPLAGSDTTLPPAQQLEQKRRAFASSSRAAVELMTSNTPGWAATLPGLDAPRINTLYEPANTKLPSVVSPSQAQLASSTPATLAPALKYRFHDITTSSFSVLSDTYAGGLKQDLTRILASSSTGPTSATPLWTPQVTGENTTFVPTWGHLRSFATTEAIGNVITPQLPVYGNATAGQVGISPVLTYAALGFRYSSADLPAANPNTAIRFNIFPVVVLWNPYTKILAGRDYEVGIGYGGSQGRVRLDVNTAAPAAAEVWVTKEIRDLRYAGRVVAATDGTGQPLEYFRFKVTCPDLAAGESRIFTLQNTSDAYAAGTNTLAPGLNPDRHVWLSNLTLTPAEADKDFRFTAQNAELKPNGNSEVAAYLGDGTAPPVTLAGAWDPALNRWYQSIQRVDYAGIPDSYTNFSDAELLRPLSAVDEPALKWFIMSVFSSVGKSYVINNNFGASIPRYRWIAQANIRAPYLFRTLRDPNFVVPYYARVGVSSNMWPVWFLQNASDLDHASSGLGLDYDIGGQTTAEKRIEATLFEFRDAGIPLFSIGQLQHANVSLAGSYPSYPIGNAIADFRLPDTGAVHSGSGRSLTPNEAAQRQPRYYDISWLLNRSLWDRYYFSAVKTDGTFENPRHILYETTGSTSAAVAGDLQDHAKAASRLMIAGGFNINSTSEQAWRAVLGGVNQLAFNPQTDATGAALGPVFSRFSKPTSGTDLPANVVIDATFNPADGTSTYVRGDRMHSLWQGYRALTEEQIAQLARNIVIQVRARGPFTSVADFVNRRLINSSSFVSSTAPFGVNASLTADQKARFLAAMKGVLQDAIDATTLTQTAATPKTYAVNDMTNGTFWSNTRTLSSLPPGDLNYYSLPLARGDINAGTATADKTAQRATAAFAPKFLTQADILSSLGASLTARSDTFTVRSYGETLNPATGDINGRAWCEAVVQRLPDYVDSSAATGNVPDAAPASLSGTNQKYGRKFKIISFRWLSADDI